MSTTAIFQIGSLGDSIVSIPVLRSLRELIPGCSDYISVNRFENAVNVMPAEVFGAVWKAKHTISYRGSANRFKKSLTVGVALSRLRFYRPKHCVYLMPSERSQVQVDRDAYFFRLAGVKELLGFRVITEQDRNKSKRPHIQNTEAFLRFRRLWGNRSADKFREYASPPIFQPGHAAVTRVNQWLRQNRRHPDRPLIALCPYSNYSARTLTQQVIVDALRGLENRIGAETVILGGEKDSGAALAAVNQALAGLNACGMFNVEESSALMKACDLAICTESGPMHLAGAAGTRMVITFSRVARFLDQWFPLGTGHTILYQDGLSCSGCGLTKCPVEGHPCMQNLTANVILDSVASKLHKPFAPPSRSPNLQSLDW
jgi:ADP-heptose:LPS heptosyltransferase